MGDPASNKNWNGNNNNNNKSNIWSAFTKLLMEFYWTATMIIVNNNFSSSHGSTGYVKTEEIAFNSWENSFGTVYWS